MSRPVPKRRLTLAREFRNSVKAGPRVWSIVALAFLCMVVLPLLSKLATLLAIVLVAAGLFFVGPVILRAVADALLARFKQAVVFRVFTDVGGVVPPMKRTDEAVVKSVQGRGGPRQGSVIEVEAVPESRQS